MLSYFCSKSFRLKFFKVFIFLLFAIPAFSQTRVEVKSADDLMYDESLVNAQRLIGNVVFQQDNITMYCDSAYYYKDFNRIEAYRNIHIIKGDSIHLTGGYLLYEGNTGKAVVKENVLLRDKSMTLKTSQLDYDMNTNIGYYSTGGNIVSADNKLTSQFGTYFAGKNQFFFKKKVVLVNPEYTMTSDTLMYNTVTKISYFYGPTTIVSEDNTIHCLNGWYDTENEVSQFSKNASITTPENTLSADSLYYNRRLGYGKGFRDIKLLDTAQKVTITGNYGYYNRFKKYTYITQNCLARKSFDTDTLYFRADTLYSFHEHDSSKFIKAYHKARMYKQEMQGICDSIVYFMRDSVIRMYTDPILWSEGRQLTADTISIFMRNNKIDSAEFRNNAFVVSKENSLHYSQVKGKNMNAYFLKGSLHKIDILGNAQTIHYITEENDSSAYIGANFMNCSNIRVFIREENLSQVTCLEKPEGTLFPVDQIPEENMRLKGFKWHEKLSPASILEMITF